MDASKDTPEDWADPKWPPGRNLDWSLDWRSFISEEVRAIWPSFSDEQKQALARMAANDLADAWFDLADLAARDD
jgi:hypothetical protein